ncbi:uncharacterized protein BDZ99DRAFT_379113 [Mytilinidion resinicola]|uniref:DNA-directed RNA polymerase I subunit RPA34.5 n=1 Tax=Mytilinidion resinicola TaxID=574789 RepID=A0A6A6Z2H2_9PEZI|nr:uncharacterized protein BDZ99DRAFT_379113 [Mytilinidion resinicola]KAF2815008.1 hypothetical protein BDZ99DRAFT_379113 [Mytilinidion resinicola]
MKEATKKKALPPKSGKGSKKDTKVQPPPGKKSHLSAETIDDSDSSDAETGAETNKLETPTIKKPIVSTTRVEPPKPKSKLNGHIEKTSNQKKPVNGTTKPKSSEAPLVDSDSDSNNGTEKSRSESDGAGAKDSGSDSDGDSESGVDESDVAEERPIAQYSRSAPARSHTVQLQAARPFEPPKSFNAVSARLAPSSNVMKLFNQGSVSEKQIWHVTVPAGVSIDSLKEVSYSKIANGDAVITHKGTEYGFKTQRKGEEGNTRVMLPGHEGYKAVPAPIARSLNLQQIVQLPKLSSAQVNQRKGSKTPSTIAPRAQPKGLRMRFLPSGFGDVEPGIIGSSDSEAEARKPNSANGLHRPEKRKHEDTNGDRHERPKKAKKSKDPEHEKRKAEKKARKRKREEARVGA